MTRLNTGERRFDSDDGSADPRVAAALAAYASGAGSEHEALTLLAGARLLVPLVAALAQDVAESGAEKTSEVALPSLIGADGRPAIPAFTSLDALTRWRPGARLVPTLAGSLWRAAVEDSCAVVIDVAGPVPLAVEGARLAALARGELPPLPHADPDVLAEIMAAAARQPVPVSVRLAAGDAVGEVVIQLTLPAATDSAGAADVVARLGAEVMARLGGRLRAGISVAVIRAAQDPPG